MICFYLILVRVLVNEQDKEGRGSETQGCVPATGTTYQNGFHSEVSPTVTLEPVKPAHLLSLAGLLMTEWPGQWESHVLRPKGQGDTWPLDNRWQSKGGQAKRRHGNRNDGNGGPGRSLCRTGCGTSAWLSVHLSASRSCKVAEWLRVGPQKVDDLGGFYWQVWGFRHTTQPLSASGSLSVKLGYSYIFIRLPWK